VNLMRGITNPLSAGIVSIAILSLTVLNIYVVFTSITSVYTQAVKGLRDNSKAIEIKITGINVYSNGTAYINLSNIGSIPITDIKKIEISVTVDNRYTYLLKYSPNLAVSSWTPLYISVSEVAYPVSKISLKPGETLVLKAIIPDSVDLGSYIEVVAFLPEGKAHIACLAGE